MGRSSRRFRLGLFVLGTGGLFLALLGFILQGSLNSERAAYFILFEENVKGMVVGSKVNFQGVPIGVVKDIRFQDGKTLVELRVDPSRANIQNVTMARLDRLLVTGQVTVELEGYGPQGRSLAAGAFIRPKEDPMHSLTGSIPEMVERASSVLMRLDGLLQRVDQVLGDQNQAQLAGLLGNLERASANFADQTLPEANALLRDVRATNAAMQRLEPELVGVVRRVEPELVALLREGQALAGGLRGPLQTALASFRTALDDVRGLARQLKMAPDSLLFGVDRPAAPMGGER